MDLSTHTGLILLVIKLVTGLASTIAALALWSRTREMTWIFLILAAVLSYADGLFSFLDWLGLFSFAAYQGLQFPWIQALLTGGPPLLMAIGFGLAFRSYEKF